MSLESLFEVPDSTIKETCRGTMDLWARAELNSAIFNINGQQPQTSQFVNWRSQSSYPHGFSQQPHITTDHHSTCSQNNFNQPQAFMNNIGPQFSPVPNATLYQQWPHHNHPVQMPSNQSFLDQEMFQTRQNTLKQYSQRLVTSTSGYHRPGCHETVLPSANFNRCTLNGPNKLQEAYQSLVNQATGAADQPKVHITITQTPNRLVRKLRKRKRFRTAFTTDQVLALEQVYSTKTYINKTERQVLTQKLNISDKAIKVWFQNRRMKGKRESLPSLENFDECENTPESSDCTVTPSSSADSSSSSSPNTDLEYLESQMNNTDEFGFVRLDDKALGALINIINPLVPHNIELECIKTENVVSDKTARVLYEPISPAESISYAAEEIESWKLPKDKEVLQKLFDVHFC